MTSLRQLIRRPFKTLLGIFLIIIACTLLCVSLGQYFASLLTQQRVEAEYTTIALPTNKFHDQELLDEEGNVIKVTSLDQPWEVQNFLLNLPEQFPQAVKSMEQHELISGYCKDMELMNYTGVFPRYGDEEGGMGDIDTIPYTCAMLVIRINEIVDVHPYLTELMTLEDIALQGMNPYDYGMAADVTGTVLEVCALQSGYESPVGRTIQLKVRTETEEELNALGLEVGEKYLVYGTDYTDLNHVIKCWISKDQNFYDSISWENIVPLTEEEKQHFYKEEDNYAAKYMYEIEGQEFWLTMSSNELEMVDSCKMTVCSNPMVSRTKAIEKRVTLTSEVSEGKLVEISAEEYNQRYQQAAIAQLDSSSAEFLENPGNQIWQISLRTAEINNHAFPIIATDNLQSIAQFGVQDAFISDGRRFTAEEYEQGRPVCVISESLAVQNGLSVGDSISIQYYEYDQDAPDRVLFKTANPSPYFYSLYKGFSSEEISYEIVGLYRQKQEWMMEAYSLTPNTIFVPKKSVCGETETSTSGVFCTLVLKNGMTEWLEEELTGLGYDGLLAYYDQGYSDIAAGLSEYFIVSKRVQLVGIISWCILIAVFLFLFPGHQRQVAERMWTLGAPRAWVIKHIFVSGMGIVLPGVAVGGIVSIGLMQHLLMRTGASMGVSLEIPQALLAVAVLTLVQLMGLAGLTLVVAGRTVRSFYGK